MEILKTTLPQFIDRLKLNIQIKQRALDNGHPEDARTINLLAISEMGIGKTQMILKVGESLGKGCCKYICGSNVAQGDLSGVPTIYTPKGEIDPVVVKKLIEDNFPHPPKNDKEKNDPSLPYNRVGFVFIDELASMDPLVMKELLNYIDGNKKDAGGNLLFPVNWFWVGAMNSIEHSGETVSPLPANVLAKFESYIVEPDVNEFIDYMKSYKNSTYSNGFHPYILTYILERTGYDSKTRQANVSKVLSPHFNEKETMNIASPRNWEVINTLLREMDIIVSSGAASNFVKTMHMSLENSCIQVLGKEIGEDFITYIDNLNTVIDPKDFISKDISTESKWKEANKKSLSEKLYSVYNTLSYLTANKASIKDKQRKSVLTYFEKNTAWLLESQAEEQLAGIIETLVSQFDLEGSELYDKKFEHVAKKSIYFNS